MYNADVYRWWKKSTDELYKDVFQLVKHLDDSQSYRQDQNIDHMRLYGDYEVFNLKNYNAFRAEPTYNINNRITLNIIKSMIDTVVSKITKNRPKPTFLTEGGDWSMQRKAKKLTQFVEGQFQAANFYQKSALAFLDACIFGTGALKIFAEGSEIKVERIFIDEIKVDDGESIYGEPRQMHQCKLVHKDVLKAAFPDQEGVIDMIGKTPVEYSQNYQKPDSQMVKVIESWHLPSSKDANDGKHTITVENHTLFEEEWKKDYFPFVFFRWGTRPLGFWGQGLAEQLSGLQYEINKILRTIQVSMHLVSIPKVYVEANSKIVSAHLNNKIGGIVKYIGTPPTNGALANIPPELFAHLDRLYQRAYEIAGISALSATSAKPAGLNSGKALREYNDLETERFMSVAMRYEQAFLDAAKIMVDQARDIYAIDSDYAVKVSQDSFLKTIKWKEVNLDQDKYVMRVFPTSFLSSTPAGRLQDVQELMQAGFIGKEDGMKLLDFPDLREYYNFNNAGIEDIERQMEKMIDDGEYQTPEPYQNLELGIVKMQQAYLRYRSEGAPDEKLELFRRWIEDARALIKKAQMELQQEQLEAQAAAQATAEGAAGEQARELIAAQEVAEEQLPLEAAGAEEAALASANNQTLGTDTIAEDLLES